MAGSPIQVLIHLRKYMILGYSLTSVPILLFANTGAGTDSNFGDWNRRKNYEKQVHVWLQKERLGSILGGLGPTLDAEGGRVAWRGWFWSISPVIRSPFLTPFWHDFRTLAAKSEKHVYFLWILRRSWFLSIFWWFLGGKIIENRGIGTRPDLHET